MRKMPTRRLLGGLCASLLLALLGGATPATAAQSWWQLTVSPQPYDLQPESGGTILVFAANLGDASVTAASRPLRLTDQLPAGVIPTGAEANIAEGIAAAPLKCATEAATRSATCEYAPSGGGLVLQPFAEIRMEIKVRVEANAASGGEDHASISGGESDECRALTVQEEESGRQGSFTGPMCSQKDAGVGRFVAVPVGPVAGATTSKALEVSSGSTPFGVEDYSLTPENEDGSVDTQAGSHPFQLTTTLRFKRSGDVEVPPALPKDLKFMFPPGLVANPAGFTQSLCTEAEFSDTTERLTNTCPASSAVGVATVNVALASTAFSGASTEIPLHVPLFDLVPARGEPLRLAFEVDKIPVTIDTSFAAGGDYSATVTVRNISQLANFISSRVTVWGVPGDPSHDGSRGWGCVNGGSSAEVGLIPPCAASPEAVRPAPLLLLPSWCGGALPTSVQVDSWAAPSEALTFGPTEPMPQLEGCEKLPLSASVTAAPDGGQGASPTGITVDEHVDQEPSIDPNGLVESDIKGLSVTLPEGVVINPAGADGLEACPEALIGLDNNNEAQCPPASKIGTIEEIRTPLLTRPLKGSIYLAQQDANPFGSLVAMYIYAEEPEAGIRVKAAGEIVENPVTGQITAHFERDPALAAGPEGVAQFLPQVPFEDIKLHFFGGERAPLATPARCGSYTTTATFTPWSGNPSEESSSEFDITSGADGTPCPGATLPFAPTLTAGTTNINAGAFSQFTMTFSRQDGQQNLQALKLKMPVGLIGLVASVKPCGNAQADAGTCGPESKIGETIVSVGLGGDPFTVTGGEVFLTEGYDGAPYGLSIVNPAVAGPFNLGKVVVRARIEVDPLTAALTVTTNTASEGYAIPQILDGIPLEIKHVSVTIDRSGFIINPTNCDPQQIQGSLSSSEGAAALTSPVPFQVTNCASLAFKPKLAVRTDVHTSRNDGASLNFKISYPAGAMGSESWFKQAKFEIPKQLPARLTTLRQACLQSVFQANPAACPEASRIGSATVSTPVLANGLSGPVYFVSNGSAKFPEVVIVLQGEGILFDVHGETFISTSGITSATFPSLPDVPFTSIDVNLPTGPHSEFAALGNLCSRKLVMPNTLVPQSGIEIEQNTRITVDGCSKSKRKTTNRARDLRRALKACHKDRDGRARCEARARSRYRRRGKGSSK